MSFMSIANVQRPSVPAVLCILLATWLIAALARRALRRARSTPLRGPPSRSLLFGVGGYVSQVADAGAVYEQWAEEYGPVYRVPNVLGSDCVVLCDPRAVAHFYNRETFGYIHLPFVKAAIEGVVGRGLLVSDGEDHKRQRKALSPAFSNAAIRNVTSVFIDSAYKVKAAWDSTIDGGSTDSAVIDVQSWMNRVSLDSVGIAGFSHDFGSLRGRPSAVADVFAAFGDLKPSTLMRILFLLMTVFPALIRLPTPRRHLERRLNASMGAIAEELLANTRRERTSDAKSEDKSIIGLLIKAENNDGALHMTQDEVMAQMKVLISAGYETTSISLTWALVELCRSPETQAKLRAELSELAGCDPSWEQLTYGLPYLDAVVHEVLRLHPPVVESVRVATEDDALPLSAPMPLRTGALADHVAVAQGQHVMVSISCVNRSAAFWGSDAKVFRPERWLAPGLPARAQELQGHRHLLTFVDGPRMCLGRGFALAEFKAVLSVLIRSFEFEFRDGSETVIETVRGILPRPQVKGEQGPRTPLRVRRVN